ncbi:MAG: cysteine--tRNA ligase [Methylobacterium sp.]|nr:cysteine--tRNA ligase [Methylobacterium sp.]MCA3605066.1 cysteine--tRNA ligase [Methylobacterium sp.]MCA3608311.1 cysteine--tRNA ligase [Methylobacterium sp.]MCA3619416.1 cysteine--tRNA ligase [Methylobacterium sp.]MCA3621259.1 cysteine--tRNA ligase [Methylobacterium sp.]
MTNQLRLYNTLTRKKEPFAPLDPSRVRMYVCGPTVYDFAHIGNARPVIVFDVLFRLLRHIYGAEHVIYTRNITDVDDKINDRAARDFPGLPLNEAIRKVTEGTNAQFQADVKALGCLEPTHQPRATEHIDGMKALCERLVAKGVAYVAEGHVLFSPEAMNAGIANSSEVGTGSREEFASKKRTTANWPRYGKLANRSLDEMIAGARVDVAPYKKGPTDFVLWKPSADHEPGWASPCGIPGKGRPGWHIECSAMSMATLLEPFGGGLACDDPVKNTFDIHGGGIDLVFPHHENEIAQSCCAFGSEKMASIWMHNGFLQVEGQKMSKSLGNFVTINQLLATEKFGGRKWDGQVLRLAMLRTHYTQPIDWTIEASKEAEMHLDNWSQLIEGKPVGEVPAGVLSVLADDLNTPAMIAELHKTARASDFAGLKAALDLLGFNLAKEGPYKSGVRRAIERAFDKQHIDSLITARLAARAAKNWAESDRIRDELAAMGIQLKDGKDEAGNPVTTWEVKR